MAGRRLQHCTQQGGILRGTDAAELQVCKGARNVCCKLRSGRGRCLRRHRLPCRSQQDQAGKEEPIEQLAHGCYVQCYQPVCAGRQGELAIVSTCLPRRRLHLLQQPLLLGAIQPRQLRR